MENTTKHTKSIIDRLVEDKRQTIKDAKKKFTKA